MDSQDRSRSGLLLFIYVCQLCSLIGGNKAVDDFLQIAVHYLVNLVGC
jgi:hypothetical protein